MYTYIVEMRNSCY